VVAFALGPSLLRVPGRALRASRTALTLFAPLLSTLLGTGIRAVGRL